MSSQYSNKFALLTEEADQDSTPQTSGVSKSSKPKANKANSKREFDRKSGTGRNDTEKRGGKGSYNWGTEVVDDLRADNQQVDETFPVDEEDAYVEPETVSLEEFQKQKAMMKPDDDILELREAQEKYGNVQELVVRSADVEDEEFISLQKAKKSNKRKEKKKGKQNLADEFLFGNSEQAKPHPKSGNGNRHGNRGGNRSTRGGYKNSKGTKKGAGVNISDKSSFPSLVSA